MNGICFNILLLIGPDKKNEESEELIGIFFFWNLHIILIYTY